MKAQKRDFSIEIKRNRHRSKLNKPSIWNGVDISHPGSDDVNAAAETPAVSDDKRHTAKHSASDTSKRPPRILPVIDKSTPVETDATVDHIADQKQKGGE